MNGTQRRALVSLHFMNSNASKGTSRAEVTLNSEKIKPASFAIVELHWSEGIRQLPYFYDLLQSLGPLVCSLLYRTHFVCILTMMLFVLGAYSF